ncbi:MAG: FtsX-like permease family protein, partial [Chloroflexota bacterium]
GAFQQHRAALRADTARPFRIVGLRVLSRNETRSGFQQTIFIDELNAINPAGDISTLENFERVALPEWTTDNQRSLSARTGLFATSTSARAAEASTYSLRVEYTVTVNGSIYNDPVIIVKRAPGASNPLPVVVSQAFADFAGRASGLRRPFAVGDEETVVLNLGSWHVNLRYQVVGVVSSFPTMSATDRFLIANISSLRPILNSIATPNAFYSTNQAWLTTTTREPGAAFISAASSAPGFTQAVYAWDRYNGLRREPLPNAITGMLFAGFWVSLGLGLLDFAFYLAMTARRRATSFAVLRAMGWNSRKVWGLLTVEQAALVTPALVVGVALGALLAYLLLPFLALLGGEALRLPFDQIGGLLVALVFAFALLLGITARFIQRMSVHTVLRLGEE